MGKDPAKPEVLDEDLEQNFEVPEDDQTPPASKEVNLDEEEKTEEEFKKLDNKAFAAMRKEAADAKRERDDLRKQVETYKKPVVQTVTAPVVDPNRRRETIQGIVVPETKQEWDALAKADWQAAVDLRSIISARKVRDEHVQVERTTRTLDESKNKVLLRHPELADVNSDKSKIFLSILDKNPEYLSMSKGPIVAMREMEEEMEAQGFTREQIFDSKKAVAQTEATRINRSSLTQGGRMPEKTARTVTLSKDDLEFCTSQGINPKDYAKEKLNLENNKRSQL